MSFTSLPSSKLVTPLGGADLGPASSPEEAAEGELPPEAKMAALMRELEEARGQVAWLAKQLETRDERYQRMIEHMPAMLFIQRGEVWEYVNSVAIDKLAGGDSSRIVGHSPFEFVTPEHHEGVRHSLKKLLIERSQLAVSTKRCFRSVNGEMIHAEVAATVFEDERGEALQVLALDVSEKHAAEEKQRLLARELEETNLELENLLYTASHDLRSPLLNLHGFSQWIEKEWKQLGDTLENASVEEVQAAFAAAAPKMEKAFAHIRCGVNRMNALLEGLLRLSRLGRAAVHITALSAEDVAGLVQEVLTSLEYQVEQAGAELHLGPLPGCRADRLMLSQALTNLLDNAVKYRSPERPCRISLRGRQEGARTVYEVEDNGLGIAPEHQARVFELFRRGPTSPAEGHGLGLALVQRCLARMDGRVSLQSVEGQGSTFTIDLPAL